MITNLLNHDYHHQKQKIFYPHHEVLLTKKTSIKFYLKLDS